MQQYFRNSLLSYTIHLWHFVLNIRYSYFNDRGIFLGIKENKNMSNVLKIKQLEGIIEELKLQIHELKEGNGDKPKAGDTYYTIANNGFVQTRTWNDEKLDNQQYAIGNAFLDFNIALNVSNSFKIGKQMQDFANKNNPTPIDWEDENQWKHYIAWDCKQKRITFKQSDGVKHPHQVYFTSKYFAKKCVEEIGEDNIKIWLDPYKSQEEATEI